MRFYDFHKAITLLNKNDEEKILEKRYING